jgi:hypothetical protein
MPSGHSEEGFLILWGRSSENIVLATFTAHRGFFSDVEIEVVFRPIFEFKGRVNNFWTFVALLGENRNV